MHISKNSTVYNEDIQQQESKNSIIENPKNYISTENSETIAKPLSYSRMLITHVRKTVYSFSNRCNTELMSAETFKNKLHNNENFSPNICYVVYAELPKEDQAYSFPNCTFSSTYNYLFNPNYYGTLDLSDIEITKLPDNLHVKGSVNLSKSKIFELPKKFIVDGGLNVSQCCNLSTFPEGLHVKGSLDAHKSGIKQLNRYFKVDSMLNLSDCIHLTEIPEEKSTTKNPLTPTDQLKVYACIDFSGCINIKKIPEWILRLPRMETNDRRRTIYLHNIGITSNKIDSIISRFQKNNQLLTEIHY